MKRKLLSGFILLLAFSAVSIRVHAQGFGEEGDPGGDLPPVVVTPPPPPPPPDPPPSIPAPDPCEINPCSCNPQACGVPPPNPCQTNPCSCNPQACGAPPAPPDTSHPAPPPPPPANPCHGKTMPQTPSGSSAQDDINNAAYAPAVTSLTSTIGTDVNEKSTIFGVNQANGALMTTPVGAGGSGSTGGVTIPAGMTPFGGMHTHTNTAYPTPSAGDIYALAGITAGHPSYQYSYVIASDGSRYMLEVYDPSKAAAWLAAYPPATTVAGDNWIPNTNATGPYHDYLNAYNSVNPTGGAGALDVQAFETAQSYVLTANDTGITLLKMDASGNYSELHFDRTVDASGKVTYTKHVCP
jgi:hypothetical protein